MKAEDWKKILVSPDTTIKRAMELIDETGSRVALVVDKNQKLLGSVTDGDIRRAFLKQYNISDSVQLIMNENPTTALINDSTKHIYTLMQTKCLFVIPILDESDIVVGIETIDTLTNQKRKNIDVVLMAGGFGKRLYPLTQDCPKPLLRVGSKPLLENIIENFILQGFNNFYISTYYKSEAIQDYFQDGSKWGCGIKYILEEQPLGTAGALSLLPKEISSEFIVMNGDIITNINFDHLCHFHRENKGVATMCIREYVNTLPYGVVDVSYPHIDAIHEKPSHKHFVNAGIYLLNNEVLREVQYETYLDMPSLFQKLIEKKYSLLAFPIHEYWLDIGRHEDYERAQQEHSSIV